MSDALEAEELPRLQAYLQYKFKNKGFALKLREKANDSAEVLLDGEFIGVVYKDNEDKEVSYDLNIGILDIDIRSTPNE